MCSKTLDEDTLMDVRYSNAGGHGSTTHHYKHDPDDIQCDLTSEAVSNILEKLRIT